MSSIEEIQKRTAFHERQKERAEADLARDREDLLLAAEKESFVTLLRLTSGPTETARLFPKFKAGFRRLLNAIEKDNQTAPATFRLNHVDIYGEFIVNGKVFGLSAGGWGRHALIYRKNENARDGYNWNLDLASEEAFAQSLREGIEKADPTPF